MNDLLRTRFFILLADTSQEVINTEMQDAYEDFVKQIVTISNSEDYTYIFRMLNLTYGAQNETYIEGWEEKI